MPPRRRGYQTARPARRKTLWTQFVSDPANVTANGMAIVNLTDLFTTAEKVGATVIRIIGVLRLWAGAVGAITEGTAGIAYVSNEADAASAFPDPATDAQVPWMWWQGISTGTILGTAVGDIPSNNVPFDVKAMRKFRAGIDDVHMMIENHDGTNTFQFTVAARTLIKLS